MWKFKPIRGWAAFAAALLASAGVSPATAGDLTEIDCPLRSLGEADQAAIAALGIDRAARAAAVRTAAARIGECSVKLGWNEAELQASSHYVPAFLAGMRYRRILSGTGLDVEAVEREVLADAPLMDAAVSLRPDPPELSAFMARLFSARRDWVRRNAAAPDLMETLGGFVAATALAEGARIRFSRA